MLHTLVEAVLVLSAFIAEVVRNIKFWTLSITHIPYLNRPSVHL